MLPKGGTRSQDPQGRELKDLWGLRAQPHVPENPLRHVARKGRQHRDHPQRAHPLHDPVLGERKRREEEERRERSPGPYEGSLGTRGKEPAPSTTPAG